MTRRHHEFWHPRLFETPYYASLAWHCLRLRLPPRNLARANYALDHGEIGIGSKLGTQMAFSQERFLPAILLPAQDALATALEFAGRQGYPLILKPDIGSVGKGVVKVIGEADLRAQLPRVQGPYLLQQFTPNNVEFGVFVVRQHGRVQITGINRKHFPTVVGNGRESIGALARQHERFSPHWALFLKDHDLTRVPPDGESVQLSFIGSHTLGCKFTDDTHLCTPALLSAVTRLCESQPGFNFGRLDVKAASDAAFGAGEFVVIEVNGIASLPTHMFDPSYTVWQAWHIFLSHARLLVEIANEHRNQDMPLLSWREIIQRVRRNKATLEAAHSSFRRPADS